MWQQTWPWLLVVLGCVIVWLQVRTYRQLAKTALQRVNKTDSVGDEELLEPLPRDDTPPAEQLWGRPGLSGKSTATASEFAEMESPTLKAEREKAEAEAALLPPVEGAELQIKPQGKRCEDCRYWDREEGQAAIAKQPTFVEVARFITPNDMMRRVSRDGKNIVPPKNPLKHKHNDWRLFGQCESEEADDGGKIVHGHFGCEYFEPREPQPISDIAPRSAR